MSTPADNEGITIFSRGRGKKKMSLVYDHVHKEWFIYPAPCHPLIPFNDGCRLLRCEKLAAWSWIDLKKHCSDAIRKDISDAIDTIIETMKGQVP